MKNRSFQNTPPPDKDYTQPTRSTVMFQGKFRDELEKTMELVEQKIKQYRGNLFTVNSVISGNNNLKIRLTQSEHHIEMIINCVFRYRPKDEKYGYIDIDLTSSGFWRQWEYYYVGKFSVLDRGVIVERILNEMIDCVREIV